MWLVRTHGTKGLPVPPCLSARKSCSDKIKGLRPRPQQLGSPESPGKGKGPGRDQEQRWGDLSGDAGPGPLPPLALWTRGTRISRATALCGHLFGVVTISQTLSCMGDICLPHHHSPEPRLSWCGSQEAVSLGGHIPVPGWTPVPLLAGHPYAGHNLQGPGWVTVCGMGRGQTAGLSLHPLGAQ